MWIFCSTTCYLNSFWPGNVLLNSRTIYTVVFRVLCSLLNFIFRHTKWIGRFPPSPFSGLKVDLPSQETVYNHRTSGSVSCTKLWDGNLYVSHNSLLMSRFHFLIDWRPRLPRRPDHPRCTSNDTRCSDLLWVLLDTSWLLSLLQLKVQTFVVFTDLLVVYRTKHKTRRIDIYLRWIFV